MRQESTNKQLKVLLPKVLSQIGALQKERPDLIVAAWQEIVGERVASMTQAVGFERGILAVKVKNSTLYSILSGAERGKLLKLLRGRFPAVEIKNIHFKLG
ncbi:MAG: hypothetical protein RLZZ453_315 [Chlamydiota bacterium]|jgi:hypothetical protein